MASIQKRPNGKWRARYRDDEGREHSRHFDRKTDASKWLGTINAGMLTGSYVDPATSKVTLRSFYAEWATRQVWAATTVVAMNLAVAKCTFAGVELGKLRRSHVETWVKSMVSSGLAPSTIRTRVNNVRSVLRAATRDRLLSSDPSDGVTLPRLRKSEHAMRIPTPDQVRVILEASEEWFRPFIALCAFAGLRIGESSAMRLTDVDFLRRTIGVRRQVQRATGDDLAAGLSVSIVPPKYGSERDVFVPDELTALIARHVERVGVRGEEQWLFVGDGAMPPHANSIAYWWKKTTTKAGIEGVTLRDLRHYFASGLIASGCSVATVQRALGHSSPSITLNTYTHLWPTAEDHTRKAAGAMMRAAMPALADSSRTAGA